MSWPTPARVISLPTAPTAKSIVPSPSRSPIGDADEPNLSPWCKRLLKCWVVVSIVFIDFIRISLFPEPIGGSGITLTILVISSA